RFRDYFGGLMGQEASDQVYVSRVYESEQDDRHKFTVITRTRAGDRVIGLIGASVPVDARMVALDMGRELPGARVVGPPDQNRRSEDEATRADAPRYVVVLHRDYAAAGQKPAAVTPREASLLETFTRDPDLTTATDLLAGNGAYVNYTRVGNSHFVVMTEHSFP